VTTSPVLKPFKKSTFSISTVDSLCAALDITLVELQVVLSLPPAEKYSPKAIPKKDGTDRMVYNPDFRLRRIQRRINRRILADPNVIGWPDHIFGSISNQTNLDLTISLKDYISCARVHCCAKSILNIDITNFFENIHQNRVVDIFSNFLHFDLEVSEVLAELCCFQGKVVQGALTSSYLASLCLYDVEGKVVDRLHRKNLQYTRLVDDITVSSKIADYDFDYASTIIESMLVDCELPINAAKTKVQYTSTTPLTVHGLRVSFPEPRLPSDEVRKIRAAVQNIEKLSGEAQYRTTHSYRHDFNKCLGRVNKLSRVGHSQHSTLVKRLQKIFPLPSFKDIGRVTKIVERLELDFATKKSMFWYMKRFYLAHERLNVLQRTYPAISHELRTKLKGLRPTYA
jgi:RNA-directed DNA polymerase